jgi:hypothetical protein
MAKSWVFLRASCPEGRAVDVAIEISGTRSSRLTERRLPQYCPTSAPAVRQAAVAEPQLADFIS